MNKDNWKKSCGDLRLLIKGRLQETPKFSREELADNHFRIHHKRLGNVVVDVLVQGYEAQVLYHPRSFYRLVVLEAVKNLDGVEKLIALPINRAIHSAPWERPDVILYPTLQS